MPTHRGIPNQTRTLALIVSATLIAFLGAAEGAQGLAAAQQGKEVKNPLIGDPYAIQQGKALFRLSCSFCHGMDARGGSRGPDLSSGRRTHGDSDAALFQTITKGVPGTEMPPNDLKDDEVWMVIAFLRSVSAGSAAPVPGNREAGEKIFFGSGICFQCHMVNGKGGRLGPDLSRVGAARSTRHLIESIRDPSKEIPQGYETVGVVSKDGRRLTGVRKNEDTFSIQFMDANEQLHLLLKKDLKALTYERKSLMPAYSEQMLGEKDLQDLLAYLDGLRGGKSEQR